MNRRKPRHLRVESLETRAVMSAGTPPATAMVGSLEPGPVKHAGLAHDDAASQASTRVRKVELIGQATGFYTSTPGASNTGTAFHVNASGPITPIGPEVVIGSFDTAKCALTITGPAGELRLVLKETSPFRANTPTGQTGTVNPGGPMIPASKLTSDSSVGDPIILVNTFRYEIKSGTGQYALDRGTGRVQIQTTPGLTTPTGPGIYASSMASETPTGRTILTFTRL